MTVGVPPIGARLHGRYRDLGAGKEARLLPGLRDEIGLGEGLDQTLFLQRGNQGVDPESVGIDHLRQQRAERRGRRRRAGKEPAEEGAADAAVRLDAVRWCRWTCRLARVPAVVLVAGSKSVL